MMDDTTAHLIRLVVPNLLARQRELEAYVAKLERVVSLVDRERHYSIEPDLVRAVDDAHRPGWLA